MINIELYCNLTTYVELYLLHRLMIHKTYQSDTSSIDAVIEEHRNTDKTVLLFLHKPTRKTVQWYVKCDVNEWPSLRRLVSRRDICPEILDEISMKKIIIRPIRCPNKAMVVYDTSLFVEKDGQTEFEFRPCTLRNIFTIHTRGNRYVKFNDLGVKVVTEQEKKDKQEWYVLKVYPDQATDLPTYMIWVPGDRSRSIGYRSPGITDCIWLFRPGRSHLWTFHPA